MQRVGIQRHQRDAYREELEHEQRAHIRRAAGSKRLARNVRIRPQAGVAEHNPAENLGCVAAEDAVEDEENGAPRPAGVGKGEWLREHADAEEDGNAVEERLAKGAAATRGLEGATGNATCRVRMWGGCMRWVGRLMEGYFLADERGRLGESGSGR